jgi:hypothetical protein
MSSRTMTLKAVVSIALIGLAGCQYDPPKPLTRDEIVGVVENWLSCDECWNRQINHVITMGDQATPILLDYFNGVRVLQSDAELNGIYEGAYDRLEYRLDARGLAPVLETKGAYVARHKEQHRARIQTRAAIAIAALDRSTLPPMWRTVGVGLSRVAVSRE